MRYLLLFFFFFNDTATTEIYTLSLHDALPILIRRRRDRPGPGVRPTDEVFCWRSNKPSLRRMRQRNDRQDQWQQRTIPYYENAFQICLQQYAAGCETEWIPSG